jgi:aldehyde dehydrogenase (NAD+)/betaine-aldehyde dehydrogenase
VNQHSSTRANALAATLTKPGAHVAGEWVYESARTIEVIEPSTGAVFTSMPQTPGDVVARAVGGARATFDSSPWRHTPPRERSRLIHRLADLIEENGELFVQIGVADCGAPISLSRELHLASPVRHLRWWADAALRGPRPGWEESLPIHMNPVVSHSTLVKEPIGVVASILAYNAPLMIACFKVGPALAAGCTTVMMPSPAAALASIEFMRLVVEAGIPAGVVNLVLGEAEVGKALSENPALDMVSFTGSVAVGRQVMQQAASGFTKVVLELGGKSANIVLPGAPLERVVAGSLMRYIRNSGQACGATTRIFVHRSQEEDFIRRATDFLQTLTVGDPWEEQTVVGPVISAAHAERVRAYLKRAVDTGGHVVTAPLAADNPAGYVPPTLVLGLGNDSEICQEELFAPIAAVVAYDTVDEAVDLANASRYGLNGMVWGPPGEALGVARRMNTGTIAINGGGGDRADVPWGGYGESGIGTERGDDGFAEFFRTKHLHLGVTW